MRVCKRKKTQKEAAVQVEVHNLVQCAEYEHRMQGYQLCDSQCLGECARPRIMHNYNIITNTCRHNEHENAGGKTSLNASKCVRI